MKKDILIVKGATHGMSYYVDTESYTNKVKEFFDMIFWLFVIFTAFYNNFIKCDKSQGIGNYHEIVKEICKLPYKVIGKCSSEEDKYNSNYRVNDSCCFAVLKEILNIYFTKEVPADNCCKCEEH